MKNADKPINPVMMQQVGENEFRASKPSDPKEWNIPTEGLTKREYFAGLAMQSLVNTTVIREEKLISKIRRFLGLNVWKVSHNINFENISESSIKLADELLKQLEND